MKKFTRFFALILALASMFSCVAFADLQSGAEKFGGEAKKEKDMEQVKEIYEDLILRAYEFDEDLLLPELEHMLPLDEIEYKYVQCKRGRARGQSIYEGPFFESKSKDRWYAKDGCLIKIYAKYGDAYFCELFINEDESEGTIGWIPTSYTTSKWSESISNARTVQYSK